MKKRAQLEAQIGTLEEAKRTLTASDAIDERLVAAFDSCKSHKRSQAQRYDIDNPLVVQEQLLSELAYMRANLSTTHPIIAISGYKLGRELCSLILHLSGADFVPPPLTRDLTPGDTEFFKQVVARQCRVTLVYSAVRIPTEKFHVFRRREEVAVEIKPDVIYCNAHVVGFDNPHNDPAMLDKDVPMYYSHADVEGSVRVVSKSALAFYLKG